jgi:hypothetical protein
MKAGAIGTKARCTPEAVCTVKQIITILVIKHFEVPDRNTQSKKSDAVVFVGKTESRRIAKRYRIEARCGTRAVADIWMSMLKYKIVSGGEQDKVKFPCK